MIPDSDGVEFRAAQTNRIGGAVMAVAAIQGGFGGTTAAFQDVHIVATERKHACRSLPLTHLPRDTAASVEGIEDPSMSIVAFRLRSPYRNF
jgi:hypothetical protein